MTGDSIWDAIQKLEAGTVRKRDEGLNDLRLMLNRIQSTPKIHELREAGWHKILDALFALVKSDKHDLLSGSAATKKRAASRLSTTAEALRLVVNLSTPHLRHKTAYAVLDHVDDSLDFSKSNEEPFRSLILGDYLKILRIILASESHGEHLRPKDWGRYVDVVLTAINATLDDNSGHDGNEEDDNDDDDNIFTSPHLTLSASSRTPLPARPSQNSVVNGSRGRFTQSMEDMLVTLLSLTSVSNSPLLARLDPIADTMLKALSIPLQSRATAFKCLNNVLLVALTEDVFLVSRIAARVVVLIRHLWSSKYDPKANSLQEQMLTTLLLIRHYLRPNVVGQVGLDLVSIEALAQTISDEYENRNEQNTLQLSDIVFSRSEEVDMYHRNGIAPDLNSFSATFNWTLVAVVALLRSAHGFQFSPQSKDHPDASVPRKRQRRALPFADLLCWLTLDTESIDHSRVLDCKESLLEETKNEQTDRPSWALLVLARLSKTSLGHQKHLQDYWIRVWKAASNLVTSQLNSRAACFAMMTLLETDCIAAFLSKSVLVDYCFHGGIRGPTSLTDAALMLFSTCLRSTHLDSESKCQVFRDKVLAWLDVVWLLPSTRDHHFNVEIARMSQSYLLHDLMRACVGEPLMLGQRVWTVSPSAVYQTYLNAKNDSLFAAFNVDPIRALAVLSDQHPKAPKDMTRVPGNVKQCWPAVADLLFKKLDDFRQAFRKIESATLQQDSHADFKKKRRANLSIEIAEIVATACVVTALIIDSTDLQTKNTDSILNCWQCVGDFISLQQGTAFFEGACLRLAQRLLEVWPVDPSAHLEMAKRRLPLISQFQNCLAKQSANPSSTDEMDIDFFIQTSSSQPSQIKSQAFESDLSRHDVSFSTSVHGAFEEARILLLQESFEANLADASKLATAIVDHLVALPSQDLLASRVSVMAYILEKSALSTADATKLLQHIAKVCLEADEFERNEAALCFCLKVLTGLAHLWVSTDDEDLADIAFDIYSWFVEVALGKGIASSKVLRNIADLLDCLSKTQSRYGTDSLPSPRTSLLRILKTGKCSLKFQIVPSLGYLFEGYVLTEHSAIFDDIVDCLPTEPSDQEGIAVRLYILAKLGSRWSTILRQAVYHIFETAANVTPAILKAKASLQMLTKEVGLKHSPTQLLDLFSPQVFYTWLEDGSLGTVPFSAFGYHTLLALVKEQKGELVAQAVLRQSSSHKLMLEEMLQQTWPEILEDTFARAQVYAVATDMVDNRAGADIGPLEDAMRNDLGVDSYIVLAKKHFAEAVALAILSLSDDRSIDKVFSSSSRYKSFSETYQNIRQKGSSSTMHPPRQQPSFRAKYLMQILSKLCQIAEVSWDSLWTPALLVYVYRRLLNDAHSALGPLHIASIIRKIRLAVTLAGDVALRGYPLEMLLRALKPFLIQFHSSEDAIGVYWYLLDKASAYLEANLPFLTGLSVSTFVSLVAFASSTQQSTTQESQFVSTMSKAEDFRKWFGAYLANMKAVQRDEPRVKLFRDIVGSAKEMTRSGTNNGNEQEGTLLYHLLMDQSGAETLVSKDFFKNILRALSVDFRLTEDHTADILINDQDLIASVPILWSSILSTGLSDPFRTWVGRILGKAYNIRGPLLRLTDHHASALPRAEDGLSRDQHASIRQIIAVLASDLWDEDVLAVGVAERTLSNTLGTIDTMDRKVLLSSHVGWTNLEDLVFAASQSPMLPAQRTFTARLSDCEPLDDFENHQHWASMLAEVLISETSSDDFLNRLIPSLQSKNAFAESVLPMIVHLVLDLSEQQQHDLRASLSKLINSVFRSTSTIAKECSIVALHVLLYLRRCIYPGETNFAARNTWLNVDFVAAANAALNAGMPEVAFLMLEIGESEQQLQAVSQRSSTRAAQNETVYDTSLLASIFQRVSDVDFFYGCHEESDIYSVLTKLRHENENNRVLALQSALFDATTKTSGPKSAIDQHGDGIVSALSSANLHGLTFATQQYTGSLLRGKARRHFDESMLNIHQWDIPVSAGYVEHEASLHAVLSKIEVLQTEVDVRSTVEEGIRQTMNHFVHQGPAIKANASQLVNLAAISAVEQLLFASMNGGLTEAWESITELSPWVGHENFTAVSKVLIAREAVCAAMRRHIKGKVLFRSTPSELLLSEIKSVRFSLAVAELHDATQFCLNRAAYLSQLQEVAQSMELDIDRAVTFDIANTLWSQGEITAPIEMLKKIENVKERKDDPLPISKSELLTDLGQKLSQARLHRPDEITQNYLQPAIRALERDANAAMAGRVYHNFAAFCDEQLRDSVAKDDFERISKIRNKKSQEISELAEYTKKATGKERDSFKMAYSKAKLWFKLDDDEYKRLKANRETLLRNCLENYILSIQACDDYNKDVLRFLSLWLGNPKVQAEESSIREYLRMVPSMKMAPFVNQLSSRLADSGEQFQKTLFETVFRICRDHPFHSLYQLFSVFKSKGAREDDAAKSRQKAADRLARHIQSPEGKTSSQTWVSIHNSNILFVNFAQEKNEKGTKTGKGIPLRSFNYGKKLEQTIQGLSKKIPPPTLKIALRRDKDYTALPTFTIFEPDIVVAGGVSAPKITTIVASDGSRHKMLLKGGNDDLRQDAIMEQVFEQVSDLLQEHRPTRQRKLGIRTYKVIPLTHNAGIIEFVKNTIPLHEYLLPAHVRYYPKDYKPNACRQQISNAQTKSTKERIKVFETIMRHFHPVMRYFFMERFLDPDDWFHKRLAYSRSTAAISILGHVLGLGDRHGHNILLDEQSGEVVHIDLGVAFEAGRVLPVPEVVPFRLTRDLVDGMGLSGVEGPFRRCCNFTLEALRKNQDVIMTILDVLRWDPLYSWSVSLLRVHRMQDAQEREAAAAAAAATSAATSTREDTPGTDKKNGNDATTLTSKKKDATTDDDKKDIHANPNAHVNVNEPGEADRALSVVAKKLSAGLSVEATVNELIRQATDVDNLAVLYCGWAAYA